MYIETIPITMNAKVEPATEPMITGRSCDDSFSSLYRRDKFYWWRKPEYPDKITILVFIKAKPLSTW
jgi:hypothetical protein